jgi:hypothetical protein
MNEGLQHEIFERQYIGAISLFIDWGISFVIGMDIAFGTFGV